MHEVEDDEVDTTSVDVGTNGGEPTAFSEPSLIDLIRLDVKEISEAKEVYIPIPGYENSGLAAKYRLPDGGKELDSITNKVNRQFKDRWQRNLYTAIDTMIALCDGLYVKTDPEDDTWYELDPQLIGEPVRFDLRLAAILGFDEQIDSARQIVRAMFGKNELAIMNHAERLARWVNNTKADVTKEIWQDMGE